MVLINLEVITLELNRLGRWGRMSNNGRVVIAANLIDSPWVIVRGCGHRGSLFRHSIGLLLGEHKTHTLSDHFGCRFCCALIEFARAGGRKKRILEVAATAAKHFCPQYYASAILIISVRASTNQKPK